MGRHKKVKNEISIEDGKTEAHPFFLCSKSSVRQLTGEFYGNASGDDYRHSIRLAIEWSDRVNRNNKLPYTVSLSDYYCQEFPGKKSILFTYNMVVKHIVVN